MMRLAEDLGRERAHDLVYAAVREARENGEPLEAVLQRAAGDAGAALVAIPPDAYVGAPDLVCNVALGVWDRADAAPLPSVLEPHSEL